MIEMIAASWFHEVIEVPISSCISNLIVYTEPAYRRLEAKFLLTSSAFPVALQGLEVLQGELETLS